MSFLALGDRRSGRTSAGIAWVLDRPDRRVLVVADDHDRARVANDLLLVAHSTSLVTRRERSIPMGSVPPGWAERRVITVDALRRNGTDALRGSRDQLEFWIDNVEQVLHLLLRLGGFGLVAGFGVTVPGMKELLLLDKGE